MFFNDMMFNPKYVNNNYYSQIEQQMQPPMQVQQLSLQQLQYNNNQELETIKAVKAMQDLCEAVKNLDNAHQEKAFNLCLAEMVNNYNF